MDFERGVPLSRMFSTALVCAHEAGDACAQNDKKGGFRGTQGTPLDPPLVTYITFSLSPPRQMRKTKKVSVWLVGISGGVRFEGPVCHDGRVTGWYTMWGFERAFQIDMAGTVASTNGHFLHFAQFLSPAVSNTHT